MNISTIVFAGAIALFCWSCYMRFRLLFIGKKENRFDNIGQRIRDVLYYAFGQRCTVSHGYNFGLNHLVLFWSFIILLTANTEFLLEGLFPGSVSFSLLPVSIYHPLALLIEIASLLALLSVCVAMIRRLAFAPSYIEARSRDAFIILSLIALLMLAFFGLHAGEIKANEINENAASYMPVSRFAASAFFSGIPMESLGGYINAFWWLHAIVLLAFLNYLPYSKHMHILTGIPNVFFRSLTKVNTQGREEFKTGNVFGVVKIDQFTWKGLMDSYSCTECGRCSDNCPATATGKLLNPRLVIHDIKVNLLKNGPLLYKKKENVLPLIGQGGEGRVAEEVLWACTTCGACMEVCPVFIEHVPRIVDMRRNLVEMSAKVPDELLSLFENIEQRSNPWGIVPAERVKWAAQLDIQPFEAGKTEYLFYVGCFGAFDARSRKVSVSISKILNSGGISWGTLGKDELCCGDSLRRLGNEFVFDRIAQENVRKFKEKGVRKIITQCPHCYNTLKNDYRQYGLELEVIHHTEFINDMIRSGKLDINEKDYGKLVFHDSCYLGRYNGIYNPPREILHSISGKAPIEMDRRNDRSFCCGAGGGRMWMEESTGKRINVERVEEALKKDPKTICVCCPYCMTMFEDGLKDLKAGDRVQIMDVAEILSESLKQ